MSKMTNIVKLSLKSKTITDEFIRHLRVAEQ